MEQIKFKSIKIKQNKRANERGDLLVELSKKLGKPICQIGSLLKNWEVQGIRSIYLSSEALSRDKGMEFGKAFWWHYNEIKKDLRKKDIDEAFEVASKIHGSTNDFQKVLKQELK